MGHFYACLLVLGRFSYRPSGAGILPGHPCLLEQRGRPEEVCRVAGGTGSSRKQKRNPGSSRWGTPWCTYRSCLWSLAGCVRVGVPCFFSVCLTNNHCVALTSKDSSFLMTLIRIVAISYRCHFECLGVSDVTRL